jgi:hypothetical protein
MIDLAVWLAVGALAVIGIVFAVHLYLKYRGRPKKVLKVEPDKCCYCGKEEKTNFFCKPCCLRLVWRYAAILSGVGCFPLGAAVGLLIYAFSGNDMAIIFSIIGCIVLYWIITLSYFAVYTGPVVKIDVWTILLGAVLLPLLLVGIPVAFGMNVGPDPSKIHFTFREEWWRFKLLLRQLRGQVKSVS